ncbi:MAG: Lrp/AsnC family transcriptional regulator [Candidatus Pacearchaeota archaeon]|nr:Lrp/AsnC family transcriptional regulator [Candidatus Pacearchaeota archaeon]
MDKSRIKFGDKVKLDKNDKKIIEILQKEARLPVTQIAKKVRMPADSVKYRIQRLEKLGVIRFYHAVINFPLLGYPMYSYTPISLFAMNETEEKLFINYLISHPQITWVSKTTGNWDFIIGTCAKDFKEYDEIIKSIRLKFIKFIKEFETISTIEEFKYDMMYGLIE